METELACENMAQFLDVVAGLVKRGIVFTTQVGNFKVYVTGGY